MKDPNTIIGLPWQQAKSILQAAYIPFSTVTGDSYAKRFQVEEKGPYVGRVHIKDDTWEIVLFYPMVYSEFETHTEVHYAEELLKK